MCGPPIGNCRFVSANYQCEPIQFSNKKTTSCVQSHGVDFTNILHFTRKEPKLTKRLTA